MKTSTKYLLAAALVLLASLTAYNMALRTEYRKGNYKDPLRDFTTLNFKNFEEVAVPAATTVSVKIVAGPFSVRLNPHVAEVVHVRQQGRRLVITADFPERQRFLGFNNQVVISCPHLAALSTDAVYVEAGQLRTNKHETAGHIVQVQGFRQDSLRLQQDHASRIELSDNELKFLQAVTGTSAGSHSYLQLNADNHIAAASLTLGHQSELTMNNVAIPLLHRQFADSVKVTLWGAALGGLAKESR